MPYQEHAMSIRLSARGGAAAFAACLFISAVPAVAQMAPPALIGSVTSDREGGMEGVLVSAKKPTGTITVTVTSDAKGDYAFPADRLEPGRYELTIRAAGYALEGLGLVELAPGKTTTGDLRLKSTPVTTDQLTNSEWMASVPGPDDLKRALLNCADCHSLRRIFESNHTAADFLKVFERMSGYYPGASDLQPQRLVGEHRRPAINRAIVEKLADYLASVNLSRQSAHDFEAKISPRPTGRATRVIITEYDLPRKEIQPHDVVVDPTGMVWFSHFGEQFLSKLDPKTGKVTDFPIPVQKPNHPKGTLDLEIDADGYLWVGLMYQTGMARFDRTTAPFSCARRMADGRYAAVALLGRGQKGRWQGLGQEHGPLAGHAARPRNGQIREPRELPRSGQESADRHLRNLPRSAEQRPYPRVPVWRDRQDRREDRQARVLSDTDAQRTGAARARRFAEPTMVCRVWRQWRRHVRSRHRDDHRMEEAASVGSAV